MEYAKDEVFGIQYRGDITYQIKRQHKLWEFWKKNSFISSLIVIAILFASMNGLLIYHFMNVLAKL